MRASFRSYTLIHIHQSWAPLTICCMWSIFKVLIFIKRKATQPKLKFEIIKSTGFSK
jgi:hypothetical protein